jgi:hypothetical protein
MMKPLMPRGEIWTLLNPVEIWPVLWMRSSGSQYCGLGAAAANNPARRGPHPKCRGFQSIPAQRRPENDLQCRRMRRGVADMHRRAEISPKANDRLWDALSTVDDSTRISEFARNLEEPCPYRGRRVRALRLFQPDDRQLLQAVNRGEFAINGLRNETSSYTCTGQPIPITLSRRKRSAADAPL